MPIDPVIDAEFSLDGKVAVVTGAGSGIGREIARVLALAGARVVMADINRQGMDETAALLPAPTAILKHADVTRREEMDALADAVMAEAKRLDVWVNCAGTAFAGPLLAAQPEQTEKLFALNVMGPLWGCIAAARIMQHSGGGAIVNVSSGAGAAVVPNYGVYCMSKAAVNHLTRNAAQEFGPLGIRVNAIAPGFVETPLSSAMFRDAEGRVVPELREQILRGMTEQSLLKTYGRGMDMALATLYLASNASRFITGQVLHVDGGASM